MAWPIVMPMTQRSLNQRRGMPLAIVLGTVAVYELAFALLYQATGEVAAIFVVIPVALAGWLWGPHVGLVAGLLGALLNILNFTLVGQIGWEVVLRRWPAVLVSLAAGFVMGVAGERVARATRKSREASDERDRFFDLSMDLLCIAGLDGYFKRLNPAWERTLGFSRDELCATPFIEWVHRDDRSRTLSAMEQLANGRSVQNFENRYRCRDGSYRWLSWIIPAPERGSSQLYAAARDITEYKRVEEALQRSIEQFNLAVQGSRDGLWDVFLVVGDPFNVENPAYYSPRMKEIMGAEGKDQADVLGTWVALLHPDDRERIFASLTAHLTQRIPYDIEYRIVKKSGECRWIAARGQAQWNEAGDPVRMSGSFSDITERKSVEEALCESEERYRILTDATFDGIAIHDQGLILEANSGLERMFGYGPGELIGKQMLDTVADESREMVLAKMMRGEQGSYESVGRRKDGSTFYGEVVIKPYRYKGREVRLVAGRDITEHKLMEGALQRTNEELERRVAQRTQELVAANGALCIARAWQRDLIEAIPGIVWECDARTWQFTFVSSHVEGLLGYSAQCWIDEPDFWQDHVHPDDREWVLAYCLTSSREERKYSFEYRMIAADGRTLWLQDIVTVEDDDEGPAILRGIMVDVTERKQTEAALRASQERFELTVRGTNDGIWDWDILTGETYWSDRFHELLGYRVGDLVPGYDLWADLLHQDDREQVLGRLQQHLQQRIPYNLEYRIKAKSGIYRWFHAKGQAVWDASGKPVRMAGSVSDVTVRKQVEAALASSEQKFRLLAESAIDMIYRLNEQGQIIYASPASEQIFGYAPQEMIGSHFSEYFSPSELPLAVKAFKAAMTGETVCSLQLSITAKDGRPVPTEVNVGPICEGGLVIGVHGIVRDITERKQMEAMLRQSHAELESRVLARTAELAAVNFSLQVEVAERKWTEEALEKKKRDLLTAQAQAHLGSWSWDIRTGVSLWSDENYRIFGFEPGSIQPSYEIFAGALYGEDRERVLRAAQAAIEAGTHYDIECRIVRPSGEIRHVHSLGDVTRDDKGQPFRMAGTVLDITERKWLEEQLLRHNEELERRVAERTARVRELESQRAQTEKLAALGQLAAGVAHEINNPVAGIKNAFLVVKQAIPVQFAQYHFVGMIEREIDRVSHIVKQLYQLYRAEPRRAQTVDLAVMTHDLAALLAHRLAQRHLSLHIDMDAAVSMLHLPQGDLLQVLLNLLSNAIDSSPEQAAITLRVREASQAVFISVTDRGTGIPPEVLAHIFEPFFTTKTTGPSAGMGLGLSVSHSLVQAMGGRIEVQTRVNEGTTVTVVLPVFTGSIEPSSLPQPLEEVSTHDR